MSAAASKLPVTEQPKSFVKAHQVTSKKTGNQWDRKAHDRGQSAKPMSQWHTDWQNEFPKENRESIVPATAAEDPQSKKRRADVATNLNIIEFQHSNISREEVRQRTKDLKESGAEVWWVVDVTDADTAREGQTQTARVTAMNDTKTRWLINVTHKPWRYQSFQCNAEGPPINLVLDTGATGLFLVNPAHVKNGLVEVQKPKERADFVLEAQQGTICFETYDTTQNTLYRTQRGAGNGKTYEAVRMATKEDFFYKNTYVYVTKAHTAKQVLVAEFKEAFPDATVECSADNKKIVAAEAHDGKMLTFAFLTVDAMLWGLAAPEGERPTRSTDIFQNLVESVAAADAEPRTLRVINKSIRMDKTVLLVCDETQDLPAIYLEAFATVARQTHVDIWMIGDKLQSLQDTDNAFVAQYDEGLPHTNTVDKPCENKCRRFGQTHINFVNAIIPFDGFDLPRVSKPDDATFTTEYPDEDAVVYAMKRPPPPGDKYRASNLKIFCRAVTHSVFAYEVKQHKCLPEDFMVVSPFVNNDHMKALESHLQEWWQKQFESSDYRKCVAEERLRRDKPPHPLLEGWDTDGAPAKIYAHLHKSEDEGKMPVDPRISQDCTRMVSIRSAKGDGRQVVLAFDITESALSRHCETHDLVYVSKLHVALTRQKRALYVFVAPEEILGQKIKQAAGSGERAETLWRLSYKKHEEETLPSVNIDLDQETSVRCSQELAQAYAKCADDLICKYSLDTELQTTSAIIEGEHHLLRWCSMLQTIHMSAWELHLQNPSEKAQVHAMYMDLTRKEIALLRPGAYYKMLHERREAQIKWHEQGGGKYPEMEDTPLLVEDNSPAMEKLANSIEEEATEVIQWVKNKMDTKECDEEPLTPRQMMLLIHMLWTHKYLTQNPCRPRALHTIFLNDQGTEMSEHYSQSNKNGHTSFEELVLREMSNPRLECNTKIWYPDNFNDSVGWKFQEPVVLTDDTDKIFLRMIPSLGTPELSTIIERAVVHAAIALRHAEQPPKHVVRVAIAAGNFTKPIIIETTDFIRTHSDLIAENLARHASVNQAIHDNAFIAFVKTGKLIDPKKMKLTTVQKAAYEDYLEDDEDGDMIEKMAAAIETERNKNYQRSRNAHVRFFRELPVPQPPPPHQPPPPQALASEGFRRLGD